MKNFKNLLVWQKGMELVVNIYKLSAHFPSSEKFGITSQIRRASVSIPANIAEGSSRDSDKDYKRFLEIALGSAFELETELLIIKEIGLAKDEALVEIFASLTEIQKMLNGFIETLRRAG